MKKEYTPIWNNFQIVSPTYLDGHLEPDKFDIVKWAKHEPPIEATDWKTGKKKMVSDYCFSIGELIWDRKEPGFEFESCGLRYFEHRIDGLEEWILEFCKKKEEYLREEDE